MSGATCRRCKGTGWIRPLGSKKKIRCPGDASSPAKNPAVHQSNGVLLAKYPQEVQTTLSLDDMYSRFQARELSADEKHGEEHIGVDFAITEPIPGATGGFLAGIPERLEVNGRFLSPVDSMWHHLVYDDDGNIRISPERLALYQDIFHRHLAHVPASENPKFIFMGGGPAAGKTSLKNAQNLGEGVVDIAADDIKAMLPEYKAMQESENRYVVDGAALFTHDESSFIAYEIQRQALTNRQSILLDGCGGGPPEKLLAKANEARQKGYRVEGRYMTCPTSDAVDSCLRRAKRENRHVHFDSLLSGHASVSKVIPVAAINGTFDDIELYDRTGVPEGDPPVLIMKSDSQGARVYDKARWKAFTRKAKGDAEAEKKVEEYQAEMRKERGDIRGVALSWAGSAR